MTIQTFLESLGDKLRLLGVDEVNIRKHLYMFEKYLSSLSAEELEETLSDEDQLDAIAVNIYKLIKKKAARSRDGDGVTYSESASDVTGESAVNSAVNGAVNGADNAEDSAIAAPEDFSGDDDMKLAGSDDEVAPDLSAFEEAEHINDDDSDMKTFETPTAADAPDDVTAPSAKADIATTDNASDAQPNAKAADDISATRVMDTVPHAVKAVTAADDNAGTRIIDAVKPIPAPEGGEAAPQDISFDDFEDFTENVPGSPKFWVLFFVTLPISLAVVLAILGVFAALFTASAVMIVGLIASLIALVAGGTALSLVGIIYGITQTVITLPIGLYEIGLGITIGGATMLAGILIYNFAVRLLPFVLRKLVTLLAFIFERLRGLFYRLKRESAKK